MICFCRIDDRLIHGQVVTTWVNIKKIEQIIVVNDKVAEDKIHKNILNMSAPIKKRTMLLFTNSIDVDRVVELGVDIKELNIGGMRYQEGRKQLTKALSVTPEEEKAFHSLMDKGVDITIQMVPNDEAKNMREVM